MKNGIVNTFEVADSAYEAEKQARLAAEKAAADKKAAKIARAAEKKAAGKAIQADNELYAAVKALEKAEAKTEPEQKPEPEKKPEIPAELKRRRRMAKYDLEEANRYELATQTTDCHQDAVAAVQYASEQLAIVDQEIKFSLLNDGNPMDIGTVSNGHIFTVSPSTAKKARAYYTTEQVKLTKYELRMPGVVIAQNRGMLFSSSKDVNGNYTLPSIREINFIIVPEKSRKLTPVDDKENKIYWKGNGDHKIKDVVGDGQGQHWLCDEQGRFADELWFKVAKFGYGVKGIFQPGLASDVGAKVVDRWGIERTITMGNTILMNESMVKGVTAYNSLEEFIDHAELWGLTKLQKQWQSGDHKPAKKRIMGTQPNATNLQLTFDEITDLVKPEALEIWTSKFQKISWMRHANISSSRGRGMAARPSMMYSDLVKNQIDTAAGNKFLRIAQGKFMAEGQYLKMYQDKLAYALVYVHGMDINEAARKAAETGLHGEIRVNPAFAGQYHYTDEDGNEQIGHKKETHVDDKGRYIETALVRYPHGAPSETIIVKAYLDATVPVDVIMFPLPVADENGNVPVAKLFAFRLQGADFDGDAVTAYTEKKWLEAQRRNVGKGYMIIPVNTEGTEKDKTMVTDETWDLFLQEKVASLTNQVGLIATSLKYFLSQDARILRAGTDPETDAQVIADHACAMGDDIDEFKHGKAANDLVPFVVSRNGGEEYYLWAPYFIRYAKKYRTEEAFNKAVYKKDGSNKKAGAGVLDMYAKAVEQLMEKCKLPIVKEVAKATDGNDRWYFTVHPVQWETRSVELFISEHGEGQLSTALPPQLEEAYGIKHGTLFTAKDLFQMLYRDHAATAKTLMGVDDDKDQKIKSLIHMDERFGLAKVAIIAWTKAMKKTKEGVDLTAEEALKVFTTLMVQHTKTGRSTLQVLTETGSFYRADGTVYERTIFDAQRVFNYFRDLCGDGLLFLGTEKNDFPEVSDTILEAAHVVEPDLDKAMELARKEVGIIGDLVELLPLGLQTVLDKIDDVYASKNYEEDYDASVLDDGSVEFFSSEEPTLDY